jgi:hypothetical protein
MLPPNKPGDCDCAFAWAWAWSCAIGAGLGGVHVALAMLRCASDFAVAARASLRGAVV